MYALSKSPSPANVLKDLSSCSSRWLASRRHAILFSYSPFALHILARFLYLSVHRHFLCCRHYTSFVYFSFLNLPLFCHYIANIPLSFFYLQHLFEMHTGFCWGNMKEVTI